MSKKKPVVDPYIPNSEPSIKQQMLNEIGVANIEALYEDIPEALRLKRKMDFPEPFLSEPDLVRHVEELLAKNTTCKDHLNFQGAGCYQHFVPAVSFSQLMPANLMMITGVFRHSLNTPA